MVINYCFLTSGKVTPSSRNEFSIHDFVLRQFISPLHFYSITFARR